MTFLDQPRQSEEPEQGTSIGEIASAVLAAATAAGIAVYAHVQSLIAEAERGVTRQEFDSSCIAELEYDLNTGQMIVTFTDGNVYDYPFVSPNDFVRFTAAPSKGSFFNAEVRGKW